MEEIALLATLDSMHKLIESLNTSPSTLTLVIISSVSGILGVVIGLLLQALKDHFTKDKEIKKAKSLIDYELNRIMENASLAIQTSAYMLDNNKNIDKKKISIPTACTRTFYNKFLPEVAIYLEKNKLESIVNAFDYACEMDENTCSLDIINSIDDNKRLYNYEYVMNLAVRAYKNAENALAVKSVSWDNVELSHQKVSADLGFTCNYLLSNSKIDH
ncbi:hypothetical protein AL485_02660 [Serratia liquefaciens]|uniref:hypothetical protein n=1 Tax=Serratia liquefaciens TaxID=614 RepID=UPI000660299F|nr:hypothetical protein [Serratia liquefaciens]AMG98155.1 hypothetical protein AL485_02660 [Serratia liquefaciens]